MAEIKKISTELQLLDKFLDTSGDAGTSGQVLTSTGTGINWVSGGSLPGGPYLPLSAGSSYPLTGDLYLDDGSGATPSLYFKNGDDNFWRYLMESGGDFSIKEGTSTRLTFQAGGNVGIGTTSPGAKLELKKQTTWGTLDNQVIYINNTGTGGNTGLLHDMGSITWRSGNVNTAAISGIRNTPGSGNNVDLRFTTATQSGGQQTSMTILSGGNVGIGTDSPQSKLHLATTGGSTLTIQNTTNSGNAALNFRDEGDNDQFQIYYALGANRSYNLVNGNGLTVYSSQSSSEIARFGNASSGYTDSYFTGDVGIGTTSPDGLLNLGHVASTSSISEDASDYALTFNFTGTTNDYGRHIAIRDNNGDAVASIGGVDLGGAGTTGLYFATGSVSGISEAMRITATGNVGIGTTTVQNKLVVRGSGSGFNSTMQNSTASIISKELTDNAYHSILQLVAVRQSLTTGKDSQGYLGFSTIDDSNNQGQLDAGRIAIVNETGSSRNSATALTFWTNPGGAQTTAAVEKMRINSAGAIKFNNYNSTNNTGTPTYLLGTDASGNIVKTNTVPGSGAGPYLPLSAGSSYPLTGDLYINKSVNGLSFARVTNTNTGTSANARFQVAAQSSQIDMIATSAGYTGVTGWADAGIVSTDSGASTGLILNAVSGEVQIQTAQTTALTISSGQNSTFAGNLTINGAVTTFNPDADSRLRILNAGTNAIAVFAEVGDTLYLGGNNTTGMTLDASANASFFGNVGIGVTSPNAKLSLAGGSNINSQNSVLYIDTNSYYASSADRYITSSTAARYFQLNGEHVWSNAASGTAGNAISFAERMRIDSAGRVGIGVTPKNWTTFTPIQIGQASSFVGRISSNQTDVATNWYYDGAEKRIASGYAQRYTQTAGGEHQWFTAGTDNADSTITFSQKLTIKNNGNVGIGVTSPADKLDLFDANDNVGIYFHTATSGIGGGDGLRVGQNNANAFVWNYEATPLSLATGGTARLTINATGGIRFNTGYGAGTLVTDASGNITVSSGGGAGGPFLPLAGGTMDSSALIGGSGTLELGGSGVTNLLLDSDGVNIMQFKKASASLQYAQIISDEDKVRLRFKNGMDIYYDDTAIIDYMKFHALSLTTTQFKNDNFEIIGIGANNDEMLFKAEGGGAVSLYYNNVLQLNTTSTGIQTNTIDATVAAGSAGNFVVMDGTRLAYRTAAQVLSDIGAASSGSAMTGFGVSNLVSGTGSTFTITNGQTVGILGGTNITSSVNTTNETITLSTLNPASGNWFRGVPQIGSDGLMEVGRYIDFHNTDTATSDFDVRLDCYSANNLRLTGSLNVTQKIVVNSQLGVGITPAAGISLEVDGKIRADDSNSGDYVQMYCDGSVSGDSLIENTNSSIVIKSANATTRIDASGAAANLEVLNASNVATIRLRGAADSFIAGGDLGIGNTGPVSGIKLDVTGKVLIKTSDGVSDLYMGNYSVNKYVRFHTNNSNTYFDINCGHIYWRVGSSTKYDFDIANGNMQIDGTLTQSSDIRLKENITEIGDCISKVKAMRGVYYNKIESNKEDVKVGVIAQEVETVLPELISESLKDGFKSVAYSELTAVLINAIKEQQEIIEDLKTRITKLEN